MKKLLLDASAPRSSPGASSSSRGIDAKKLCGRRARVGF